MLVPWFCWTPSRTSRRNSQNRQLKAFEMPIFLWRLPSRSSAAGRAALSSTLLHHLSPSFPPPPLPGAPPGKARLAWAATGRSSSHAVSTARRASPSLCPTRNITSWGAAWRGAGGARARWSRGGSVVGGTSEVARGVVRSGVAVVSGCAGWLLRRRCVATCSILP